MTFETSSPAWKNYKVFLYGRVAIQQILQPPLGKISRLEAAVSQTTIVFFPLIYLTEMFLLPNGCSPWSLKKQ